MPTPIGTIPVVKTYLCKEYMHKTPTIFPILILAFAISLSSCVNEVKSPQEAQDTLARLAINYNIPDSNHLLAVDFKVLITPPWKPEYRIDWNFGDSTGIISKFDTSILPHYYQKYGSYFVTLSVVDTLRRTTLGSTSTSIVLDSINEWVDTNYLHLFTRCKIVFYGIREYDKNQRDGHITKTWIDYDSTITMANFPFDGNPLVKWYGRHFQIDAGTSWSDSLNYWQKSYGYKGFILSGDISYTGNSIDTGSFSNRYHNYQSLRAGQGTDDQGAIFQYRMIPIQKKDLDSLSFLYRGETLQQHITQFRDSSYGIFNNYEYIYKLKDVLWDKQPTPTLTITFSK
ncbi:MAG: hypothetical protein ABI778_07215 [Ignavibacteriota bacterium]